MSAPSAIFDPATIPADDAARSQLIESLSKGSNCYRCGQPWGRDDEGAPYCHACYLGANVASIGYRLNDWGRAEKGLQRTHEVADKVKVVEPPKPESDTKAPKYVVVPKTVAAPKPRVKRCPRPQCNGAELYGTVNECPECSVQWPDYYLFKYRTQAAEVEAEIAEMFRKKALEEAKAAKQARSAKASDTDDDGWVDPVVGEDNELLDFRPDLSAVRYYRSPDFPDYVIDDNYNVYRFSDSKRSKKGSPVKMSVTKTGRFIYKLYRNGSEFSVRPDLLLTNAKKSRKFARSG